MENNKTQEIDKKLLEEHEFYFRVFVPELGMIEDVIVYGKDRFGIHIEAFEEQYPDLTLNGDLDDVLEDFDMYESEEYIFGNGEITQFTGMLDINQKYIFKKDIVRCLLGGEMKGVRDVVEYSFGCFWLRHRDISLRDWIERGGQFEVIGNMFENPKLA